MLPTNTVQTSTQNHQNALSTYRTEEVNGREFLVVDGVALVEGVLNSRFVPYEEFEFAPDWNGVPVVVRHPKKNKGSARVPKPDVLEVGRFYNARTDKNGRRLLGEFWLDQSVMKNDPDAQALADAVLSNRRVEVSTGYFSADEIKRGKYNGVDYVSIDRNIRPDHIALLPDEMGACSIKDGCGLNRNAKQNCDCPYREDATTVNSAHEDYAEFEKMYKDNHPDADEEEVNAAWERHKASRKQMPMQQNVTGNLPADAKKTWEKIYNKAIETYDGDKEKAAATAWSQLKKQGWHKKGDEWVKGNEEDLLNVSDDVAVLMQSAIDGEIEIVAE